MTDEGDIERLHPGVYAQSGDGENQLVHLYQGGEYRLADVVDVFGLGRLEDSAAGEAALVLTADDLRQLKTLADAHSFDYDEEFIEMCHELKRFADSLGGAPVDDFRFTANF